MPINKKQSATLNVGNDGQKPKKIKSLTPPKNILSIKLPIAPPTIKAIATEYNLFLSLVHPP